MSRQPSKYDAIQNSNIGALVLADLANVDNTAPTDGQVVLWNTSSNTWKPGAPPSYLDTKNGIGSNDNLSGKTWFDTCNNLQMTYINSRWYQIPMTPCFTYYNNYANINSLYSPTVRFIPGSISGTAGSLTWPSSVGSGSIVGQGASLNYFTSTVGGKNAVYCNPSSGTDTSQYLQLGLGTTIAGTSGITVMCVIKDYSVFSGTFSRLITLLGTPPGSNNDFNYSGNIAAIYNDFNTSSTLLSTMYNNVAYPWNEFIGLTGAATPTIVTMRYNPTGTQWRIYMNGNNTRLVSSSTVNLNSLSIATVAFGDYNVNHQAQSKIRVAEVLVWNSALSDITIQEIHAVLGIEYGVRSTGTSYTMGSAPTTTDDTTKGFKVGSKILDNLNYNEYTCLDNTSNAAIWKQSSFPPGTPIMHSGNSTGANLVIGTNDSCNLDFEISNLSRWRVASNDANSSYLSALLSNAVINNTTTGGSMTLQSPGGLGNTSASHFYIFSGAAGGPSVGNGGNIYVTSGTGAASAGSGGYGGTVFITGGPGAGSGNVTMTTCNSTYFTDTGSINLTTGHSLVSNGVSGSINLTTGGTPTSSLPAFAGSINLVCGTPSGGTSSKGGGNVKIQSSRGYSGGSNGTIDLLTETTSGLRINSVNSNRLLQLDLTSITASNTRTLTMPDASITMIGSSGAITTSGILRSSGNNVVSVTKSNYAGTAAPTTGDDGSQGYSIGSWWFDTTNDNAYVLLDSTNGAAVWKLTT